MTQRKGLREQHQRHAWGATSGPVVGHWRYPRGLLLATLAAGLLSAGCERNPADNLLRSPPADEPSATAGAPAGEPPASPLPNRGVVMEIGSATPVAGAFQRSAQGEGLWQFQAR